MIENNNELDLDQEFDDVFNKRVELGKFLSEARKNNKISTEVLANEFLVSNQEIEGLENGYDEEINSHVVRLLAIKYAKKFGVEDKQFNSLLDIAYPKINEEYTQILPTMDNVTFNTSIVKSNNKRLIKRVLIYVVSVVFLLILVSSLIILLTKNVQSVATDTQNETTLISNTNLVPEAVIGEKAKTEVNFVEYKTYNDGTLDTLVYDMTASENSEIFEITFTAIEDAYITIYDGNWTVLESQVYIPKGETYTFDAKGIAQFNVTVDFIENIEISVNGVDIKLADQNKEGYYLVQINNKVE